MTQVDTVQQQLNSYAAIIGDEAMEELIGLSLKLKGARVLHINATSFGGGVAELLSSVVPLTNDLGLFAEWKVIEGSAEFYDVTKAIHNALQGQDITFTPEMWRVWRSYNERNAKHLEGEYDFIVVHDPQPAGLLAYSRKAGTSLKVNKWIWRCHIDLTTPQTEVWQELRKYLPLYDASVFTLGSFANHDVPTPLVELIPPGIDPLSDKNRPLPPDATEAVLNRYGVDPARPYILQASRLDLWKDPLGVLEAYRGVKKAFPQVQLVYLAAVANDDPEAWEYYELTKRDAGDDPDIHILPNVVHGIGDLEVNAFQAGAAVVLQKSLREGFGLSVTEALWKARPMVAGRVGGIPLQVIDSETGFLVDTPEKCAGRVIEILENEELGQRLGEAGREHVRKHYLITRNLRDYLKMFLSLNGDRRVSRNGRKPDLP